MKLGVVGLPNVGKSTLFNAITQAGAQAANYPFCTIEPNVGVVPVPDARLDALAKMYDPKKVTPTTIEFVDIAGLVRGASRGEGLGNKFLSHIREVDAVVHVVRCFEDENVVHVDGSVNPTRDMETINLELVFADLETVERRIDRTKKMMKSGDKRLCRELELLESIHATLESGKPMRSMAFDEDDQPFVKGLFLLTTGSVRGFALTLGLGVLCSFFTLLCFTTPVLKLLGRRSIEDHPGFWGVSGDIEEARAEARGAAPAEAVKGGGLDA